VAGASVNVGAVVTEPAAAEPALVVPLVATPSGRVIVAETEEAHEAFTYSAAAVVGTVRTTVVAVFAWEDHGVATAVASAIAGAISAVRVHHGR